MTFTEIVQEVKDRLGRTSAEATTRIGRLVNAKYRRVRTEVGLQTSSRTIASTGATSIGFATVTFTGVEKIERVIDDHSGTALVLEEVTLDELRNSEPVASDTPKRFAIQSMGAGSVTIRVDVLAQTVFNLKADGLAQATSLTGSQEPAFSESFHDVLVEGVVADELLKDEKLALAKEAKAEYEKRLSGLRMFIAKSSGLVVRQGQTLRGAQGGAGSSGSAAAGSTSYEQTGLISFNRGAAAPFAVHASSTKVTNLDADKLDGYEATAFARTGEIQTVSAVWTFTSAPVFGTEIVFSSGLKVSNTGLQIYDTNASHLLTVAAGSDLTANRTLTLTTGDAARTVTLTGNPTLADWFDQSVKTTADPTFNTLKLNDSNDSHQLTLAVTSDLTAARTLSLATGDAARTITLSGDPTLADWFDQSVKVAASPTFVQVTVSGGKIAFPATQSASADVNTLDDYEESGSWQPALGGSTSATGVTYGAQQGHYTKIGRLVIFQFVIALTNEGTIVGNLQIQGLPFVGTAAATATISVNFFDAMQSSLAWVGGHYAGVGATAMTLYGRTAGATSASALTAADITNTTDIRGTIIVQVN